ncbi:MAG TPA: twin-arginine translocase TatA/TatE family subunit [Symbiobacteriaceae bacterium]|jgi:sec-independent protein translocase protein TatA|nr:twin-arginine translocase TatA/TatE family subunit [Symbiobacteriaceae bacterium]
MRNLGFTEIALILLVVVLIFGAGKLPQLARSLGEGIKEFKKSVKEVGDSSDSNSTDKK